MRTAALQGQYNGYIVKELSPHKPHLQMSMTFKLFPKHNFSKFAGKLFGKMTEEVMNSVPQNILNFIVRLDSEPTRHFVLENVPDKFPLPQKEPCMSSTPTTSDPEIGAPVAEQTRWSKANSLCEALDLQQAFSDNDGIVKFSQELTDEVDTHLMAHHSCQNPNIPNTRPLSSLSSLTHLTVALHTP